MQISERVRNASLRFSFFAIILSSALLHAAKPVAFELPDGFVAEEIYKVPSKEQGSWICLAVDDKGRLLASDQSGSLYRLTVSDPPVVEKIDLDIGMAMGLLYHRDSLYVMVNGRAAKGPGLYRVRDTNNDDQFDSVELLRGIEPPGKPGAGHGNHAIVLGPDNESLYLVCGNMSGMPVGGFDSSRVPKLWDEDQLLPRLPDSNGHASSTMAPGGWIAKTDLDGKHWELLSIGFRNIYDAAFNSAGDLFTFDADMEFDLGTPWYRPTRVCHVVSGSEFGWRNGSAKWPKHYVDSVPPVFEIGLGSPTGVTFGYGTNFPADYRSSLFLCDWSYGRIYSADLKPHGASYRGSKKLFASFAPLPIVDLIVHPIDHSFYLVTGGRSVQSHVYRIRYEGDGEIASQKTNSALAAKPIQFSTVATELHKVRKQLERLHVKETTNVAEDIWPYLSHSDRSIRYAARVALEQQPHVTPWLKLYSNESDPSTIIQASVALARHRTHSEITWRRLGELKFSALLKPLQLDLLRAYSLSFIRQKPAPQHSIAATKLGSQLLEAFPTGDSILDRELSRLLAFLNPKSTIAKLLDAIEASPSSQNQMHYATMLRVVNGGWTLEQRKRYFKWFDTASSFVGGRTNGDVVNQIREDAEKTLSNEERTLLLDFFEKQKAANKPRGEKAVAVESRPFVKDWKLSDLKAIRELSWNSLRKRDSNIERGAELFASVSCSRCHQVQGHGGRVGPNLTGVARRFSPADLVEAIIEPSKSIPHEFQAVTILKTDGQAITGKIVNFNKKGMSVRTDQMQPWKLTNVAQISVDEITPSTVSLMPTGLISSLNEDEILDLLAWLQYAGG